MRGTRIVGLGRLLARRFIPACAGNTVGAYGRSLSNTVHPRVCGEHWMIKYCHFYGPGSSPRVRGTPVPATHQPHRDRFIPACAGNTKTVSSVRNCKPVHPRVCGEHFFSPFCALLRSGSSPRVRGTPILKLPRIISQRFIPACAGNTSSPAWPRRLYSVHPRVCGEHYMPKPCQNPNYGSSPRVRGTPSSELCL